MENWQSTLVSPSTSIIKVVETINSNSLQVALIVDDEKHLVGTVTDGDIRRSILQNIPTTAPIEKIMCKNFTKASVEDNQDAILAVMQKKNLLQIPIVDNQGRIVDLKTLLNILESHKLDNWVVLMAGGLGSRLRPLTNNCPKPLLNVGGKPILETIIFHFREYGFYRFFISLNYKAEMVEEYFGDGSKWSIEIEYLREKKQLGTAGPLNLLPERPSSSIIVMNSDLLTKVNFKQLLDFHIENSSKATMGVREYDFEIPYGVVKVDNHRILSIEEKPVQRFFVNAGIYVLEPAMLDSIPHDRPFDMTTLFETSMDEGKSLTVFPIHEYWLDIGKMGDFDQANGDYTKHFGVAT